jgi:hypothetical protein
MKTVYVERTITTKQTFCMMVKDEADLTAQLDEIERDFRASKFTRTPQRDKAGNIIFHQCNKDWTPYP